MATRAMRDNPAQQKLFEPVPSHRLAQFSKEELIKFIEEEQKLRVTFQQRYEELSWRVGELQQKVILVNDQYVVLKNKFFGKSSEKEPVQKTYRDRKKKKRKIQLPSLRYPDAPLIERDIEFKELPTCSCCGEQMMDSGMTEDSEFLTVIPAQYIVIRQKRHKYRCGKCHGDIQTAPAPPRIKPGSMMSDEMMQDVSLSKYCDLIPIERYATIAGREGLQNLPPQSLIEATHNLSDFVTGAYDKLKEEILNAKVLHADETPHRMLEGSEKSGWYLWGFSTPNSSYFDIRDTRSGDVASELLSESLCEYLVSDVYCGYNKAIRETNMHRRDKQKPEIKSVYCNAHSRRRFKEAHNRFSDEAQYFIDQYKEIYKLEKQARGKPPDKIPKIRSQMKPFFEAMKNRAREKITAYSSKSSIGKAMSYFLGNYNELTIFVENPQLPIDNNSQERLLRNPVIGRKTWYGTHSKRGAKTAAILFSLVESCKLNKVNPRTYFRKLIQDLHEAKPPFTPSQFTP